MLDFLIPNGFMVQGAIMFAFTLLLIWKFRDNKTYRGR